MDLFLGVVQCVSAVISLVATVAIALIVSRATRRMALLEYSREVNSAWMALDTLVLSNDHLLDLADRMVHPEHAGSTMDEKRRRWIAYLLLNPLTTAFVGARNQMMTTSALSSTERTLRGLVQDEQFYALVKDFAYERELVALCERLRQEVVDGPASTAAKPSAGQNVASKSNSLRP